MKFPSRLRPVRASHVIRCVNLELQEAQFHNAVRCRRERHRLRRIPSGLLDLLIRTPLRTLRTVKSPPYTEHVPRDMNGMRRRNRACRLFRRAALHHGWCRALGGRSSYSHWRAGAMRRTLYLSMVGWAIVWLASLFLTIDWHSGHRYWIRAEPGIIVVACVEWAPGTYTNRLAFEESKYRSIKSVLKGFIPRLQWASNQVWLLLPFWIPMTSCAAPLIGGEFLRYRRFKVSGTCLCCGYACEGASSSECPECGFCPIASARRISYYMFHDTLSFALCAAIPSITMSLMLLKI